jgi:adenylate kinase
MDIALIGPSGAGKRTYADELLSKFDFLRLASGDLFRDHLKKRTGLGILAQSFILRGELVPDELVDAMIEADLRLVDPQRTILFDGFPRTIYQANFLDTIYRELGRVLGVVIYFAVSEETLAARLQGRLFCRDCHTPYHQTLKPPQQTHRCDRCRGELYHRADDTPEMIALHMKAFRRAVLPLLQYYQDSRRLVIIDANTNDIETICADVVQAVTSAERGELQTATAAELTKLTTGLEAVTASPPAQVAPSLNLILIGSPGSGKGTQADYLCRSLGLPHIASGDIFRENLQKQTNLGKLAKAYMHRGELVPDDITESMIQHRLDQWDTNRGFILDGFPRTLTQAKAFTGILKALNRQLDAALYLAVADEAVVDRLSGRWICRSCQASYHELYNPPARPGVCDICEGEIYQREDDKLETIRARLQTYHHQTKPVIDYYRQAGLLIEIDGEGELDLVADRTLAAIRSFAKTL